MYTKRSVAPYCFGKLARNRFREPEQRFIALEICIGRFYFYLFADTNIHLIFHRQAFLQYFFASFAFSKGSPLHLQVYFDFNIPKSFPACRLSSSVGEDTRRISNRRLCRLSCCRMLFMYSAITSMNSSKLRTIL